MGTTSDPKPPGMYMMMISRPREDAASPAASSGRNVTPSTNSAPSSGPKR